MDSTRPDAASSQSGHPGVEDEAVAEFEPEFEHTGMVESVRPRLADFAGDGPPLPAGYLLVVAGPSRGEGLLLTTLPVVVGRAADADLVVLDDTVSRRHVELSGTAVSLVVSDLGSANGTILNGHPIAGEIHARDGDLLELGSSVVLVKTFS